MQAQAPFNPSLQAAQMRALAAKLRKEAAETAMPEFRRKMENTASELDEAAVDMETRAVQEADRRSRH